MIHVLFKTILVAVALTISCYTIAQEVSVSSKFSQTDEISKIANQLFSLQVSLDKITSRYRSQISENETSITTITERAEEISATISAIPPEILWEEMPVSSLCGIYIKRGGQTKANILCQGHSPNVSCPDNYEQANLGYFESYDGSRKFVMCVKTVETGNEISWDDMPYGSLCGVYMKTQGSTKKNIRCQGHVTRSSCPEGFSRANMGYFEAGDGDRNFSMCAKN